MILPSCTPSIRKFPEISISPLERMSVEIILVKATSMMVVCIGALRLAVGTAFGAR